MITKLGPRILFTALEFSTLPNITPGMLPTNSLTFRILTPPPPGLIPGIYPAVYFYLFSTGYPDDSCLEHARFFTIIFVVL